MTYGCHVWQHKLTIKQRRALTSMNRKGAATMCNFLPSTPNEALETILGITPLDIKLRETALVTRARLDIRPTWDGLGSNGKVTGHLRHLADILDKKGIYDTDNHVEKNMPTFRVKLAEKKHLRPPDIAVLPKQGSHMSRMAS